MYFGINESKKITSKQLISLPKTTTYTVDNEICFVYDFVCTELTIFNVWHNKTNINRNLP